MELEVPTQITYSSTHAQLSLLGVDDSTDELSTKGIATSVSTPAFISFSGFVSRSITISVTDPDGGTVNYKPTDVMADEADVDIGYGPVPELGYFSSCSSIDSLVTLASYEDLASLASAPAPPPAAITVIITPPVTGPTVDGNDLDLVGGPQEAQQAQHLQRFLRFHEAQQARYAELFDNGVGDEEFDFFGYGANLQSAEEGRHIEEALDAAVNQTEEWVGHQDAAHIPFLVPIINIPLSDIPAVHEPDAKEDVKDVDLGADAEADKENYNPLEVATTVVEEPGIIHENLNDTKLSTLETFEFAPALGPAHHPDLKFTLDNELDFGFDFSCVVNDIAACSLGSTLHSITGPAATEGTIATEKASEPAIAAAAAVISTPALITTPHFAFTHSPTDLSPYSSPSVYSTESAPHSPYPFATPQPGQQSEVPLAHVADSPATPEIAHVPAAAFDAYDPTCFDGLGFESMDFRLRADGSMQVVFDAGEDEADVSVEKGVTGEVVKLETTMEEENKLEDRRNEHGAGDASFSRFELKRPKKNLESPVQSELEIVQDVNGCAGVDVLKDPSIVDNEMKTTVADEAFEKWRQACLALAAFAHTPVKTATLTNMEGGSHHVGEGQAKADILMVGATGAIEVFGVTVPEITETMGACGTADAAHSFSSQPETEPVVVPNTFSESFVLAATTALGTEGYSEEATFEEDEADAVCPPADDIVSYIYSIPGPECMPSFAAVIAEHLSPTPAPAALTPASSFAIPVLSTSDDCALLSEPFPTTIASSSSDSLHLATESQSSNMLSGQYTSSDDPDNVPSLLGEPSPFNVLAEASIHSSSSFRSYMGVSDDVDAPAPSTLEKTATEPLQSETVETSTDIELPTTDLPNVPLDTIVEEPEDDMDEECAELVKSLAELAPDIDDVESDGDSAFESAFIALSPLLTVYEELAGGPQHLFNSLPRYARRSLDSLASPWLASLSSLASLGGRSQASRQQEDSQPAHGTEVMPTDHSSIASGAAPAAASENDSWSLVASPQPASPLSVHTPLRPSAASSSLADPPLSTPSPAIRKPHPSGFFMSRMTFCPSPSPKGPRTSSRGSPASSPTSPSPRPTPVAPQARSGGRLRSMLRKLRTFF